MSGAVRNQIHPKDRRNWFWPGRVTGRAPDMRADIELELCSGVRLADAAALEPEYVPESYVPSGPWEKIRCSPHDEMQAGHPCWPAPRCGVFRAPGFDQALWLQIAALEGTDPDRFDQIAAAVTEAMVSDMDALFSFTSSPVIHRMSKNRGNELTTTVDEKQGLGRVGLHIDSWEGGDFDTRDATMTRLCINLGPGDRYFLFVPLSLRHIALCLPQDVGAACAADATPLINAFFQHYPDAPVMRLLVRPGCGYFADTDNMVHDGSTLAIDQGNTHFTVRGKFRLLERLSR